MGNLTTPIKAALIAGITHKLVEFLGMNDLDASYVGEAAWLLLTAGIAYVIPADFGGGLVGRLFAKIMRINVSGVIVVAALLGAAGCNAQKPQNPAEACAAAQLYLSQAETVVNGVCAAITTTTTTTTMPPVP